MYEIFLDIHKCYDSLDHDSCLEIITAYVVGPRSLGLLSHYWSRITMVEQSSGYLGTPLKEYCGVT